MRKEGKAFVNANCNGVDDARFNSSERKRPHFRVLYLVLFDTSLESEVCNFVLKILNKINKSHFRRDLLL
jgi:hypothetical protein